MVLNMVAPLVGRRVRLLKRLLVRRWSPYVVIEQIIWPTIDNDSPSMRPFR